MEAARFGDGSGSLRGWKRLASAMEAARFGDGSGSLRRWKRLASAMEAARFGDGSGSLRRWKRLASAMEAASVAEKLPTVKEVQGRLSSCFIVPGLLRASVPFYYP